jgi:hypothetical protein
MKNLTSYILCTLGLAAILYLIWDKGVVIQDSTSLEVLNGYIYKVEYKVTQYEQKKTEADKGNDLFHLKENGNVFRGSGKSRIWNWFN